MEVVALGGVQPDGGGPILFTFHVDPLVPWRFVRLRCRWMDGLLGMLCRLLPQFFGMEPTLAGLRIRLGSETALRYLREHCAAFSDRCPFQLDSCCRRRGAGSDGGHQLYTVRISCTTHAW